MHPPGPVAAGRVRSAVWVIWLDLPRRASGVTDATLLIATPAEPPDHQRIERFRLLGVHQSRQYLAIAGGRQPQAGLDGSFLGAGPRPPGLFELEHSPVTIGEHHSD